VLLVTAGEVWCYTSVYEPFSFGVPYFSFGAGGADPEVMYQLYVILNTVMKIVS
jgi:hypothetical protein